MNSYFKVLVPAFLTGGAVGVVVGLFGSALSSTWLGAASLVVIPPMFLSFGIVGGTIGAMFFLDDEEEDQQFESHTEIQAEPTADTSSHGIAA